MNGMPPDELNARLKRVEERARQLPEIHRFFGFSKEEVEAYLERRVGPAHFGWTEGRIEALAALLDRPLPWDFQAYLRVLGNYHNRFFESDVPLRSPQDYVELAQDIRERDAESWDLQADDPMADTLDRGLFVSYKGGFLIRYLVPRDDGLSDVFAWVERNREAPSQLIRETYLIEYVEWQMAAWEHLNAWWVEQGGRLVKRNGGRLGKHLGLNLLALPHDHFRLLIDPDPGT